MPKQKKNYLKAADCIEYAAINAGISIYVYVCVLV